MEYDLKKNHPVVLPRIMKNNIRLKYPSWKLLTSEILLYNET